MQVLLLAEDLWRKVGGGESFYRKLIRDNPAISFCYFGRTEAANASRAPNARIAVLQSATPPGAMQPVLTSQAHRLALRYADTFARSVAGQSFDIVDVPDYAFVGPYLRHALAHHHVTARRIVHSMHGVVSDSLRLDWFAREALDLVALEEAQFVAADHRYAISARYARRWRDRFDRPISLIDPMSVIDAMPVDIRAAEETRPTLLCVGRRERRKGNDIALDIVRWLPSEAHNGLVHIGPKSPAGAGTSSDDILHDMAAARGVPWRVEPALSPTALFDRYSDPTLVLAPVRYDTFNLVALEAVACGAPVAVSREAGVCDFLDSLSPKPDYLAFDPANAVNAAASLAEWITDFPALRQRCHKVAVALADKRPLLDMTSVYQTALSQPQPSPGARNKFADKPTDSTSAVRAFANVVQHARATADRLGYAEALRGPYHALRGAATAARSLQSRAKNVAVNEVATRVNALPENTHRDIERKIEILGATDDNAPGRADLWAERARLQRLRGAPCSAVAYDLRCLRLTNSDPHRRIGEVLRDLATLGVADLNDVVEAQYGAGASHERLVSVLSRRRERLRERPDPAPETVRHDSRQTGEPVVSVIVAAENSEAKVARFLRALNLQTLVHHGKVELIIVGSPSSVHTKRFIETATGPLADGALYIQTGETTSRTAAWNCAIPHARAPYITCLDAAAMLYPDALERLADALTRDPRIDWVVGSSLASRVSADGALQSDRAFHNRVGGHRDLAFLDPDHVSCLPGLYRRDVHNRFGYYDGALRAAGATEFKMRTLPQLRVHFVDAVLGQRLDYPADDSEALVLEEVENALAWHAYRTPAGLRPLVAGLSTDDLMRVIEWCGLFRKTEGVTPRTDVDLGMALCGILVTREDAPTRARGLSQLFGALRDDLQRYDHQAVKEIEPMNRRQLDRVLALHGAEFLQLTGRQPAFRGFNDARFEMRGFMS